jgi:hypothetical protein
MPKKRGFFSYLTYNESTFLIRKKECITQLFRLLALHI